MLHVHALHLPALRLVLALQTEPRPFVGDVGPFPLLTPLGLALPCNPGTAPKPLPSLRHSTLPQ